MSTNFPGGIDTTGPSGSLPVETAATPLSNNHVAAHQNVSDAVIAVQTYLGIIGSAVTSSITYLLTNVLSIDPGHKHTKNSVTLALDDLSDVIITTPVNGNGLTYNGTNWVNSSTATADASTTVKGVTKLDTAPASPTSPIAIGVNSALLTTNSGTALNGTTNKIEDSTDTSASSSAAKLARQDANGKIALGMTYFDYQEFTSSGTWTKPTGLTGNENVLVQAWGQGGGGGGSATGNDGGGGGGGGGYIEGYFKASALGSTVTVTVGTSSNGGAAGTHDGSGGFNTTFGSLLTSFGGGGGSGGLSNNPSGGGGGGGILGAGGAASFGTGGTGGIPAGSAATISNAGFGGGGGGSGGSSPGVSSYGGGGGGANSGSSAGGGTNGGASVYAGGGGAGGSAGSASGGTSVFGGVGGVNSANGVQPGGGGGGGTGNSAGGNGGAGMVRVWVLI